MNFKLSIGSAGSVVKTTYGFFDKPMVDYYGLYITPGWNGDFDHANLTVKFANGQTQANAIAQWHVLTNDDLEWIWHIQPEDYDLYQDAELDNKKRWHLNDGEITVPTRPIWVKNNQIRYGTMVYGHQSVRVYGHDNFLASFPTGKKERADFVKVEGITREMMKPMGEYVDHVVKFTNTDGVERSYSTRIRSRVIPLIEQGYVQICTEPNRAGKISITNKGIKTMPVLDARIWVPTPDGEYRLWAGAIH